MNFSFGADPTQYRAYTRADTIEEAAGRPPGTTRPAAKVTSYYRKSRGKAYRATFSLLSLIGPLVIFAATIALVAWLLADSEPPPRLGLMDNSTASTLPVDVFCNDAESKGPLLNTVFSGTLHFSAAHIALLAFCALSFVVSAKSTMNVLGIHEAPALKARRIKDWGFERYVPAIRTFLARFIAVAAPLIGGIAAYFIARFLVGGQIEQLFGRLYPVVPPDAGCEVLRDAARLKMALNAQMRIGAGCVAVAVMSLIVATACLAHRYERNDVNGAWSNRFVLRGNLNNLLTLFFIGSILLVITNIALASAMDWPSGLLDVMSAATNPNAGGAAAAFASIKTLRASVTGFTGVLGSLLLIAIFVPALYFLTNEEIELAGQCHALFDMKGDPPQVFSATLTWGPNGTTAVSGRLAPGEAAAPDEIVVAGWKVVQAWKEKHGLTLSFTNLTSSFVALLAPLLSGGVIDLTKTAFGASG